MKIQKEKIERFLQLLAHFNEKYLILKYDHCEVCGEENLLNEIGLNWCCQDKQECNDQMNQWLNETIEELRKENYDQETLSNSL